VPDEIEVLRLFRDETPGPSTDAWARAQAAIAAAQAEESLTVRRRVRGPRRRRLFPVASLVATAAVVATLLALLLPGSPAPRAPQIDTAAYVTHVENALTSAGQDNLISYARTQYPAGTYLIPMDTSKDIGIRLGASPDQPGALGVSYMVRWAYQDTSKLAAYAANGQPVFAQRAQTSAHSPGSITAAVYQTATWWRTTLAAVSPGPHPATCGPGIQMGTGGWAGFIRNALGCGKLTSDGRQRVDGISTIKLAGIRSGLTLWVNPATYLPVRLRSDFGQASQTDFRWLSPTLTRLDQLNLTIPAHFRQVATPS
jgi:hypothetical protein